MRRLTVSAKIFAVVYLVYSFICIIGSTVFYSIIDLMPMVVLVNRSCVKLFSAV